MNTTAPVLRHSHKALQVALLSLAAALAWFVVPRLHYLADYSAVSYSAYFWPRRLGLLVHLCGGLVAVACGLVQIWLGLTHRVGRLHRSLGKAYAAGVLIASVGGLYLALTIPAHVAYAAGLVMLNAAWIVTTGMALYAIRLRRIEQHRDWMLRAYTVTFAFVTFRLVGSWLRAWIAVPEDPIADDVDTLMAWACWAVPLLATETGIQLRAMRRTRRDPR